MSPGVTILLITIGSAPGDGAGIEGDPFTPAVARATKEALGPDTHLVSKELEAAPSDEAATELGTEVHADAVVEVEWSLPDHLHSIIRMQRAGAARWFDREVGFRSIDEPTERGRTVGFAIASMMPEYMAPAEPPLPKTKAPITSPSPPKPDTVAMPPEQAAVRHSTSISFSAIAALGVHDAGSGLGGAFDFSHEFVPTLALRVGVGARLDLAPTAEINDRLFEGRLGFGWHAWTSGNGRGALGARVDALLAIALFTNASSGSGAVSKEKTLPGADALFEGSYFFTRDLAVIAGAGGEILFGTTDVFVAGVRRATLSPAHPVAELGLSIGF
jgi:hypothetical protein